MSRNADYQFVDNDTSVLETQMVAAYEAITGEAVQPASPERLFIQWVAAIMLQQRTIINHVGNQNIPSRATGENLDALGDLYYGIERPGTTAAVTTMRFNISAAQDFAILIPVGTRVTDAGQTLFWETLENVYVAIGDTYADAQVRCRTAGTVGNGWTAGQISEIVDVFDYYTSCSNLTDTEGGADPATDDEYYDLLRQSMDAQSTAGPKGGYIYLAKSVSTLIADVAVVTPDAGEVNLYVLMDDGTLAGAELKSQVLAACSSDSVRPLTDLVSVKDADVVTYNVNATYYLKPGTNAQEIEIAVMRAGTQYVQWQCGAFGRDINPSKLISMLMETGIKRVELTAPEFTYLSAGSASDIPQVARLGTMVLASGGYEDE